MRRRALLSHLQEHGCGPVREGASHSIWTNPQTGRREAIPRHNDIKKHLARSICRHLSVPVPAGD
jgi:predicted RNA binding protein YcfA (HicA-like mRNA interferase family)